MSTTVTRPATGKAARILAAADDLVHRRGFKGVTIAEIARHAHVGKGTVYLYWPTKEALFLSLLAGSFRSVLTDLVDQLRASPELATPAQVCLRLVHGIVGQPLVRALQTSDADMLGVLADDQRSVELRNQGGPALIRALLPVWRYAGLARTDWDPDRQADALEMLAIGFLQSTTRRAGPNLVRQDTIDQTMIDAVAALLGTIEIAPDAMRGVARETIIVIEELIEKLHAATAQP